MRVGAAIGLDLRGIGRVARQLDDQSVGVGDIERAAIAVLEDKGLRLREPGCRNPSLQLRLGLRIDLERDVGGTA